MSSWYQWDVKWFHVEQHDFLFKAKDELVSKEEFNIYWSKDNDYAVTQLPKSTILENYYKSEKYSSHKILKNSPLDFIYALVQKLMLYYKKSFIVKRQDYYVLDYGSGVGVFANFLKKRGFSIKTVEPNKGARNECLKKELECYKSIDYLPKERFYSAITLWHVLEHIPDLNRVLVKLYSKLQQEGDLIIAVPNLNSYDAKHYKSDWAALDVPRHLWHFTDSGIIKLVEKSGFIHISNHPLWFDAFYISYKSEAQKRSSFPFLKGLIVGFWSNLKAINNGQYSSKIYVFKKKLARSFVY